MPGREGFGPVTSLLCNRLKRTALTLQEYPKMAFMPMILSFNMTCALRSSSDPILDELATARITDLALKVEFNERKNGRHVRGVDLSWHTG